MREWYSYGWVNDGLPLLQLILDVLEWCFTIDHLIEDTAKRPDITGTTDLEVRKGGSKSSGRGLGTRLAYPIP